MNFVEPIYLVGLLAAALPVIIHLINRKKAVRVPFPAMKFLLQSQRKIARGAKIRQWILLALRMLALALLAMALAKPFFKSQSGLTQDERLPTATVYVLDTSYSMGQGKWWTRAISELNSEIGRLRPWDEVALVTSGDEANSERLSTDHADLKRAVGRLEVGQHSRPIVDAVLKASDMLNPSQLPNKRIVVFSDLATGDFRPGALPDLPWEVVFVDIRRQENPPSVGISDLKYAQEGTRQDRLWRVEATVTNRGAEVVKGVSISLLMDDETVAAGKVDVPAGKSVTHIFRFRPETTAPQRARVLIEDADELLADNERWFSLHMSDRVRVLLVNGQPSSVAYYDELFFLERALAPRKDGDSGIAITITTRDGLDGRDLKDFDVVVLANVAHVSQEAATRLKRHVEQGGGLLMSMGSQVDVNAWNQLFADILPKPLRSQKQLAEVGDPDAPVKITRFGVSLADHAIFQAFDAPGGGTLQSAQVFSYMLLEPSPPDSMTTILLSYKDGAPALIEREFGAGRVLVLTTTVDMDWTDLPTRTAYLPLTRRMLQYLARRVTSEGRSSFEVGQEVELDVKGLAQDRVIAQGPNQTRLVLSPDQDGIVRFYPPKAGVYEVYLDEESADARVPGLDFSVNVNPLEADLSPIPKEAFAAWGMGDESKQGAGQERRVSLWPKLLFIFIIFLLIESVLGTRRSVLLRIWRWLSRQPQEVDALQS